MVAGWRVRRAEQAEGEGGWLALPPDGSDDQARPFRTRREARRWADERALLAEAVELHERLDRRSGDMLRAMPPGAFGDLGAKADLTAGEAFGLSLLLFRASDLIARLAVHRFTEGGR